jgi:hypothetical protein
MPPLELLESGLSEPKDICEIDEFCEFCEDSRLEVIRKLRKLHTGVNQMNQKGTTPHPFLYCL